MPKNNQPHYFYVQDDQYSFNQESSVQQINKYIYQPIEQKVTANNKQFMNQLNENMKVRLTRKRENTQTPQKGYDNDQEHIFDQDAEDLIETDQK